MSQLNEIYEGWKNLVFQSPEIEKEAKRRIEICVNCENFSLLKVCTLCGCFMPAKCRNMRMKCKINKW